MLGAAGCAVLSSCSTDPIDELTPVLPEKLGTHTLTAFTPQTETTRTHLGTKEGDFSPVFWSANDDIAVLTNTGDLCKYVLTEGADSKDGTFTVAGSPTAEGASSLKAYYPFSSYSEGTLAIPAAQTYAAGSFAPGCNPMYAEVESGDVSGLQFSHVAGVINIRLTDDGTGRTVKSIKLISTDKPLAGAGLLTQNSEGANVIGYDETHAGVKEITLTCNEGVVLNETTPADFMFVIPAQTYPAGTLSFEITDATDKTVTKALSKQLIVGRAKIIDFVAIAIPKVIVAESAEHVSDAIKDAISSGTPEAPAEAPEVVKVEAKVETNAEVTIPQVFDQAATLTVEVPQVAENTQLTFKESAGADDEKGSLPKKINIVTDDTTAKNLVVEMPNTTVTVNGKYTAMTASTADNTLNVERTSTIEKLTVKKGNVRIYGTVNEIVKESGYNGKIIACLASQEALNRYVANPSMYDEYVIEKGLLGFDGEGDGSENAPYRISKPQDLVRMSEVMNVLAQKSEIFKGQYFLLTNDIDLSGVDYVPMGSDFDADSTTSTAPGFAGTFDGGGHTVRNISVEQPLRSTGLFGTVRGGTIRNLTVSNISVKYMIKWAGGLVGDMVGGRIENCRVENAQLGLERHQTLRPSYRVGGLIGISREELTISNCAVNNVALTSGFAMGGLIGGPQNSALTLTDCSVDNIRIVHEGNIVADVSGYFDSTPLLGDCSPTQALSMSNITIGSWTITDNTNTDYKWAAQTWSMFPYIGEKPSNCTPTLDGKALSVTPLSEEMLSSERWNTIKPWDGLSTAEPSKSGNEYLIFTANELAWIAQEANAGRLEQGAGVNFLRDIDLGNQKWTPIGATGLTNPNDAETNYTAKGHLFSGCIFGNGHTIRNVLINEKTPARGIFGQVYGVDGNPVVIKGLNAENVTINGEGKWTGGLVGYVRNVSQITDCSIKNVEIACGDSFNTYGSGGLVGFVSTNAELLIDRCSSENVAFTGKGGWNNGGLIGKFYGNKQVTVSNCTPVKGYFRTSLANGENVDGQQYYIARDGYQNSWFIGNITAQNGFDLTLTNNMDNSANWEATDSQGTDLKDALREGAYAWPYVGVYDGYNKTLTGTLTIDGQKVYPVTE